MHHFAKRNGKPTSGNTSVVLLISYMVVVITVVVATPGVSAKTNKADRMSETELQAELMAFAERLASYLYQGLQDYERATGALAMRPVVQKDVVNASMSAITIAADSKPDRAMLDMVAMVTLGRMIYETHWLPRHGEMFGPLVRSFSKGEHEVWELTARVLDDDQRNTLRELIINWRDNHPDQTGFAYLRFGYLASSGTASAADRKKASGLFKSVQEATQQVEEARLLAERGIYLATRIPMLMGSLGDLWVADLSKNQDVRVLLQDIHRLSATVHQLPDTIAQERTAAIEQTMQEISNWSRAAIGQTMQGITAEREQTIKQFFGELSQERQQLLNDLLSQEQATSQMLTEMRATLQEGNLLLSSVNELVQSLPKPDPGDASAGPAMGIEDYRALMADVRLIIGELNMLVGGVGKASNSPALERVNQIIVDSMDKAGQEGEELIDLSFKRGMLLTLFAVIALLVAQVVFIRIKKRMQV
jgi:hypothetical protein